MFHVYILLCADNSYYVGIAANPNERVQCHNRGEGAKWTAAQRPVVLVYCESFPTMKEAVARECQVKGWSRDKKQALIARNAARMKGLARCHSQHGRPVDLTTQDSS